MLEQLEEEAPPFPPSTGGKTEGDGGGTEGDGGLGGNAGAGTSMQR